MFNTRYLSRLLCSLLPGMIFWHLTLLAQDPEPEMGGRHVIIGDLDIEEEEKQEGSYSLVQSQVASYFEKLHKLAASIGSGVAPEHIQDLSDDSLRYLAAAYLHCSIQQGTCPALLEAMLEAEVINSKIRNNPACPNLERFWKVWLKNDMERRHDYTVKIGYLQATTDFRQKVRPKFVKCKATIASEIAAGLPSLSDFFKVRYAEGSLARRAIEQSAAILADISRKVPDVFARAGISAENEEAPDTGTNKKQPPSQTGPKKGASVKRLPR